MTNAEKSNKQNLPIHYIIIEKLAPKWFDFLEWLIVLSVIRFISEKTGNAILKVIYHLSFFFIIIYIQNWLFRLYIIGVTYIKSEAIKLIISMGFAFLLTILIWFIIGNIVNSMKAFV